MNIILQGKPGQAKTITDDVSEVEVLLDSGVRFFISEVHDAGGPTFLRVYKYAEGHPTTFVIEPSEPDLIYIR